MEGVGVALNSFDTGSFIEALGTYPAWMWALIALLVVLCVAVGILQACRQRRLRESVLQSEPIPAKEFLGNWITARSGHRAAGGYKLMDQPGCYVILTNPHDNERGGQDYDGVYVGQSVKVCSRVKAHLTGHGNGDVYADVRDGQDVVVRIIPCPAEEMNAREKELIAAFNATSSYNNTRGGSRRR